MAKVTISPVTHPDNSSFVTELNDILTKLASEFDKVTYRDGSLDVQGNLNVNSKRLLNLPPPINSTEPVRLADIQNIFADGVADPLLRFDLATEDGADMIGYKASGTGAVVRGLKEKLADVVHAQDFGVVGDGETSNNVAIANAVYAARGKTLKFNKGSYVIDANLASIVLEEISILGEIILDGANVSVDEGVNFYIKGTTNSPFKIRRGVTIEGCGFYYPDQLDSASPTPYSATFSFDFTAGAVQFVNIQDNVVFNAYKFVDIDDAGVGNVGHVSIVDNFVCALRRGIYISHNLEHIRVRGNNFTFGHWLAATEAGSRAYYRANHTSLEIAKSDGVEIIDNLIFGGLNGILASADGLCQFMNVALNKLDQVRYPINATGTGRFSGVIIGNTFNSFNPANNSLGSRSISVTTSGAGLELITIGLNNFEVATEDHIFVSGNGPTRKIVVGTNNYRDWGAYRSSGVYSAMNVSGALTNLQVTGGWMLSNNGLHCNGISGTPNTLQVTGATFEACLAPVNVTTNSAVLTGCRSFNTQGTVSDAITATAVRQSGNLWDKPSLVGSHAFKVQNSSGTTFTSGAPQDIPFPSETYDTDSEFVSPTFTAKAAGIYTFDCGITYNAGAVVGDRWNISVVHNGATAYDPTHTITTTDYTTIRQTFSLKLNVGDTVKLQLRRVGGSGSLTLLADGLANWFAGRLAS